MSHVFKAIYRLPITRLYQNHGILRNLCSYNKDLIKSGQNTDLLMLNLKNAANTHVVLDMVANHCKIMNNKHVIQALRSLFTLQKFGSSEFSTKQILSDPNFGKLCRQLKFQAGSIELPDVIEALKIISYVGVPSNSTIVQVLLQLIRHSVNQLNIQQIIFMDFLLNQFSTTPLIEALKIALPIVFEINLKTKINYENLTTLADALHYSVSHKLSQETIELIVNNLNCQQEFDVKIAKSIVWSICEMQSDELLRPLMKKSLETLVVHFDELNYNDMETILSKLTRRFKLNQTNYCYHEVFFDSCANYLIDNDMGFKYTVYLLRKFSRVSHCNNFLLDYMARKIHENPDLITKGEPSDIYSIAIAVAMTEYRPVYWDEIKNLIQMSENMAKIDRREILWLKFASSLCLLDIFKVDVLNRCLNEQYLANIFKKRFMSDIENYLIVWQSIKFYKPELSCLLPSRFLPEKIVSRINFEFDYPLEGALQKALGGEKYVKSSLFTKVGQQIDHVAVFRKGGFPVAFSTSNDVQFVEDLEIPPDHQLIVIQALPAFRYTLNNRQMRCSTLFSLKTLQDCGYIVIPVCLDTWEALADFEKIPYLMQMIKEKVDGSGLNLSEGVI